ncbi:hypothetical protein CI109_105506 [Kwoniella shandongensis]|uniref:Uncharacterized protein n=1 Tax=Kwoniella shandongensis TaxID=1734106 RepID=A0A5M6C2S0_9TREE|nr:uncharacterized protein CI109_002227 [Kwoniella shandongensis]KAA5529334.1 hypothetical protein CI109_002227 [Kwoniella shandongensis]
MSESLTDNATEVQHDNKIVENGAAIGLETTQHQGEGEVDQEEVKEITQVASEVKQDESRNASREEGEISASIAETGNISEDEVDGIVGDTAPPSRIQSPKVDQEPATNDPVHNENAHGESGQADEIKTTSVASADGEATSIHPESTTTETEHSLVNPIIRAVTPSSRTSTPPLGSGVAAKKKFSSVNVNQKFLSKTGSPAPVAGAVKIASLNATSPAPTSSSSSRLLSTKLTTVPSSKPSTSPKPPGTTSSASSSPWAKPVLPPSTDSTPSITPATLHQPAPTRARVLGTTTTPAIMGAGLGITASAPKPAWKAVAGEPRRTGLGLSRDFPTAMEVQEGKRAAQMAAQAQAAHNQAILQGLNAFTQLDPNSHRWDEEDEEDDVIDFGDGTGDHHHETTHLDLPSRDQPIEQPVPKSERFAEDFDRSWPRRSEADGRVLFNASSNRLEPSLSRQPPQPIQPTRLMSRSSEAPPPREIRPPPPMAGRGLDRPAPPHLQGGGHAEGRMLPPHMAAAAPSEHRPHPGPSAVPSRPAWGAHREPERAPPSHLADRREPPAHVSAYEHTRSPEKPVSQLPPRRSFSQTVAPAVPVQPTAVPPIPTASGTVAPAVDAQSAEMHTAAEKARLRRLAEEAEREAAAERARQKAKELEERLKLKASSSGQKDDQSQVLPGPANPPVQITLATRPKAPSAAEQPRAQPSTVPSGLPTRPDPQDRTGPVPSRDGESSWRSRLQSTTEAAIPESKSASNITPTTILSPPTANGRTSRPTAESFFESQPSATPQVNLPGQEAVPPKKEANFDSMLARIQAAMAQARAVPAAAVLAEENDPSPEAEPKEPIASSSRTPQAQSAAAPIASPPVSQPAAPIVPVVQEHFHVTYPEAPRSPPPAWRTYTVKLPKSHLARPSIPRARLNAAEASRTAPPKGWIMSFEPPLDLLNPVSLSRADLLLPQPVLRRYQRSEPIVSISPRELEPYEKKGKKKATQVEVARPAEIAEPVTPAESLLPGAPVVSGFKSQQLRDQRARADQAAAAPKPSAANELEPSPTVIEAPPRKIKSPVKTSAAAKAERDGQFMTNGVNIGVPERGRMALSEKPGVRFMVSSELEGDSLLEEVNKMSLETMGEGYEKEQERVEGELAKAAGAETPKTPPALARPASPSNGASTPWSKTPLSFPASHSPARSVSQHDHDAIKSVWDAPSSSQPAATTTVKPAPDATTPMYPSLNAPSSADPPAQQPLPGGMKMSFSHSQAFSSPGGANSNLSASNSFAGVRHPSVPAGAQAGYGQFGSPQSLASPDSAQPHNMMVGLSYNSMSVNPRAQAGSNGFQQGLWSPSAFGTSMATSGYGYNAQGKAMEQQKSGMGYNQKGGEQMLYGHSQQGQVQQEYRYPQQAAGAGYGQHPQQQQAYANYQGGRGVTPPQYGYNAGYGAPGSQVRSNQAGAGRFVAQAGGGQQHQQHQQQVNGDYSTQQAQAGGAYGGGVNVNVQGQGGYYGGAMYPTSSAGVAGYGGQGGRGGMGGRKMW